jgi:uncharacterized membrane protein
MRVEERIRIDAPRQEVWSFVSEPERYSEFMVGSTWTTVNGDPASGPRSRAQIEIRVGSIDLGGTVEVVEWDPPHELAWTNITGIDQRGRWILRDRGDHTDVTMRLSYQVPGGFLALVASQLGRPLIQRDIRQSLEALREAVERAPVAEEPR